MDAKEIGKIIRSHRKESGLSQHKLAKIAGLGKTVVFDVEKGKLSIRFDTLLKLLDVLNIKIDFHSPLMRAFEEQISEEEDDCDQIRTANVFVNGVLAGKLQEIKRGKEYLFYYLETYKGEAVSLKMPITESVYRFDRFPPFFEGLLPEGPMLEGLLRYAKIDRDDLLSQLIAVGEDMIGNVTVVDPSQEKG